MLLEGNFNFFVLIVFISLLGKQGFRKIDTDRWEFANEGFLKGNKHLLRTISRRKPSHSQVHQQPQQVQSATVESCFEIGMPGLVEEVDALKRDKDFLMQELVESRQHQQATDHMLQSVGQRVHLMEQQRQEMMSFLANAIQNPFFLAQFVHQQADNGCIFGVNKKRRLPTQEEENFVCKPVKDCQVPTSTEWTRKRSFC